MARDDTFVPLTGRCGCGHVSFSLSSAPIVVNCCHCRFCQRLGGSAFAVNAMIEDQSRGVDRRGRPSRHTPSALPGGQQVIGAHNARSRSGAIIRCLAPRLRLSGWHVGRT
jgi:hypothetical protein